MCLKSTQGCHSCSLDYEHIFKELNSRYGNRNQSALLSLLNNSFGSQHSCSCFRNQGLNNIFMNNYRLKYPMSYFEASNRLSVPQASSYPKCFPLSFQDNPRERENAFARNFLEGAQTKSYPLKRLSISPEETPDLNYLLKENDKESFTKKSIQGKRKFWLPSEDSKLVELVNIYGEKWSKIASLIEGRTGKQIRDRYINSLKPGIRQEAWTPAEDELLVKLYKKIGNKWSRIAHCLKGRTENQVKNRFRTCFKKSIGKLSRDNFRSETGSLKRNSGEDEDEEEFDVKVLDSEEEPETAAELKEEELDNSSSHCLATSRPLQLEIQGYNQFSAPRKLVHMEEDNRVSDKIYFNKMSSPLMPMRSLTTPNTIPQYIFNGNNFANIQKNVQNNMKIPFNLERFESVRLQASSNWQLKLYEESGLDHVKEEYSNLDTDSSNVKEEYINVKYE